MITDSGDIINRLKKEILPLQGYKPAKGNDIRIELGPVLNAFPNRAFPLGAMHEFLFDKPEDGAATEGFIAGILGALMRTGGVTLWISAAHIIFPPALAAFGIEPHKIIFIRSRKRKEIAWVMEEALKCEGLTAVVGELKELDFTMSRRLQLAVERSGVTGFIVRNSPTNMITASLTRWRISGAPSISDEDIPGVGFPCWKVELLKVRNGKPGTWQVSWIGDHFNVEQNVTVLTEVLHQQTG